MDRQAQTRIDTEDDSRRIADTIRRRGLFLAWLSIGIAALTLFPGWTFRIPALIRVMESYPAMVPETALAVLVGGIGTVLSYAYKHSLAKLGCGIVILALVVVANTLQPFRLQTDATDGTSLARTVSAFLLAATLLWRGAFGKRHRLVPVAFCTLGISVTAIPLMGYIFNAEALFINPFYTKMALLTSLSFTLLFLSLQMIHPREGWIGVLSAPERGSEMARRLLPFIVLGPILLCGLALYASRQDYVTPDLRAAVLTFAMIFTTTAASIYFANLTNQSERMAQRASALMQASEKARQEAEVSFLRAQKVAALGNLVGGVAHDFNNTLTVILGNLELMEDDDDETQRPIYVREAIAASNHAAKLTQQLLAYGRKSRLEPTRNVLDDLIAPTMTMFRRVCPTNIVIEQDLGADGAVVELDVANFQQALLNILINARDCQPDGGRIHLATRTEELSQEVVVGFVEGETLREGSYVSVSVQDSGPGMPPETLARAAEPFFTTKEVGEGSGLGLSVVSGFCLQSQGGLILNNPPRQGLSVKMVFPLIARVGVAAARPRSEAQTGASASGDILIVDDEIQVRRVIERQLELDGYTVRVAADAEEAMAILAAGPLPGLVLSDLVMPGRMQGNDLARHIRETYPSVRVLLMSGYESARLRERAGPLGALPFLQKPIERSRLRSAVSAALSKRD